MIKTISVERYFFNVSNDFLRTDSFILLNSLASGLPPKKVSQTMSKLIQLESKLGIDLISKQLKTKLETASKTCAEVLVGKEENFFLCSGSMSVSYYLDFILTSISGKKVLYSLDEKNPLLDILKRNAEKHNLSLEQLVCKSDNTLNLHQIEAQCKKTVGLIIIEHINKKSAVINPVEQIGKIARKKKIHLFLDGSFSIGHIPLKLTKIKPNYFIANCQYYLGGPHESYVCYHSKLKKTSLKKEIQNNQIIQVGTLAALTHYKNQNQKLIEEMIHYYANLIRHQLGKIPKVQIAPVHKNTANHIAFTIEGINTENMYQSLIKNSDKPPIYLELYKSEKKEESCLIAAPNYFVTEQEIDVFYQQIKSFCFRLKED